MARRIQVELADRSYMILVDRNISADFLQPLLKDRKVLLVTDTNTQKLYAEKYSSWLSGFAAQLAVSVFPAGEQSKHLATVEQICRDAVKAGLDRTSLFIALGGGVCGDMTGLAASLYMRGTRFIQIPTTLLAMVDSSVGGKTGVDLPEGKNLIGSFFQPQAVWINPEHLNSLPQRQLSNGFAELIKTALIADSALFELLEQKSESFFVLRPDAPIEEVIARSCELKAYIVSQDEREKGVRALLNYGHTFAHALESVTQYRKFEHGEAVAIGMCMAADLSCGLGMLSESDANRMEQILKPYHLPSDAKGLDLNAEHLLDAMTHDKKNAGGKIRLVLCDKIGHAAVYDNISDEQILKAIRSRI